MSTETDSVGLEVAPAIQPGTVYRNVAGTPRRVTRIEDGFVYWCSPLLGGGSGKCTLGAFRGWLAYVPRLGQLSEAGRAAANDDRAASITRLEAMLPSLSTEARIRAVRTIKNLREQLRGASLD